MADDDLSLRDLDPMRVSLSSPAAEEAFGHSSGDFLGCFFVCKSLLKNIALAHINVEWKEASASVEESHYSGQREVWREISVTGAKPDGLEQVKSLLGEQMPQIQSERCTELPQYLSEWIYTR